MALECVSRQDRLFVEALSSVDEFQTPLLEKGDLAPPSELNCITKGMSTERRAILERLSLWPSPTSAHHSEAIKVMCNTTHLE